MTETLVPKMPPKATHLSACTDEAKVQMLALAKKFVEECPQEDVQTEHHLHAGVYSRTVLHKAGVLIIGAPWNVATQFIVDGHIRLYTPEGVVEVEGHQVLEGAPGRMVASLALRDSWVTALFATDAKTVAEAEEQAFGENLKLVRNRSEEQ